MLITLLVSDIYYCQSYANSEGASINNKLCVWAGMFYPNMNISLKGDTAIGIGTKIALENDLNLQEDLGVFRVDGLIQLTKNHSL